MSVPTRPHGPRLRRAVAAGAAIAALLLPSVLAGSGQAASAPPRLSSAATARLAAAEAAALPHTAAGHLLERADTLIRPDEATPEGNVDLDADLAKVTSSTGVKLYLSVSASAVTGYPQLNDFTVLLETQTASELHGWDFPLKTGKFATSGGSGTLTSGSDEGTFGTLDLKLTPDGAAKRTEQCNASNYTVEQAEKVTGSLDFTSHSSGAHPWGNVVVHSFSFLEADLFTPYVGSPYCSPSFPPGKCSNSVSWYGGSATGSSISGETDPNEIDAVRTLHVAPKGTDRVDLVIAKAPAPTLTTSGSGASMSVTTSGGGASGSAHLQSTKAGKASSDKCSGGTEHETDWTAKFTSESVKVAGEIFSPIEVASSAPAVIERDEG